ncbi:MAG: MFS transporter [Marinilabiliales bacterium]|nr:MAG: MFS transporter [Marinilabiliales bacterium]
MRLTEKISARNFRSFLWHAALLSLAQNFMDVDTVIPAMVVEAGGSAIHIGILSAIMMGGSSFTQLFFAPMVSGVSFKKKFLLGGINTRMISLIALAIVLYNLSDSGSSMALWFIFIFISLFSLSGAFTNISYIDVLGKSVLQEKRKAFFSTRQILGGVIVVSTAFLAKKVLNLYEFPINYSVMFMIGGITLLIASAGFWTIKETVQSGIKAGGVRGFLRTMKSELKNNKKLVYFLGFVNTQGIIVSFIPFVMLYAKDVFHTDSSQTGSFLLFKVLGVVSVSVLVLLFNKKIKYSFLLYANTIISLILVALTFFISDVSYFKFLFLLGGISVSLYMITLNGVLLEISGNENRALYAGFAGAGNIIPFIFPLIAGAIIKDMGFETFFIIFAVMLSFSAFFIYRMKCIR